MLAPFGDDTWEIWVLGIRAYHANYLRITRIFEIHEDLVLEKYKDKVTVPVYVPNDYYNKLMHMSIPVVVSYHADAFKRFEGHVNLQYFPLQAVNEMYGAEYLTSTCSYMIAQAVLEGAEEIAIFGVDMAVDNAEYFYQRPCMEAWIGFAKGRGVKVTISEQSPLGRNSDLYGSHFHGDKDTGVFTEAEFNTLAAQHQERVDEIAAQIEDLQRLAIAHDGSKQSYERMAKVARAIRAGQVINSLSQTTMLK